MTQEQASELSETILTEAARLAGVELDKTRPDVFAALKQHGAGKITLTLEFDAMRIECVAKTQATCPAVKTDGSEATLLTGDALPGMGDGK